jgi:hypothetical protein
MGTTSQILMSTDSNDEATEVFGANFGFGLTGGLLLLWQ